MNKIIRIALAAFAISIAAQGQAHAEGLCIPMVSCASTGSAGGAAYHQEMSAADTPEISGSMVSSGIGLVLGCAAMIPRRRRS